MSKTIRISWINFKNILLSRGALAGIGISFIYSALWIFLVKPGAYSIINFTSEYFRYIYILILYFSFQALASDVRNNVARILFTGTMTRMQVINSKIITLMFIGIFFSIVGELNNIIVTICLNDRLSLSDFLQIDHLQFIVSIITLTFVMGNLCLAILSFNLKSKMVINISVILLGVLNFNITFLITAIEFYKIGITNALYVITKTPIYITGKVIMKFQVFNPILYMVWGILFYLIFIFIMRKKEI